MVNQNIIIYNNKIDYYTSNLSYILRLIRNIN